MLFNIQEPWWCLYAPFVSASSTLANETYAHPHKGQVLRYMRRLHGVTRFQVINELHRSPSYLDQIESAPDGAANFEVHVKLASLLKIPPHLLDLSEGLFLPDHPERAHVAAVAQVRALLLSRKEASTSLHSSSTSYKSGVRLNYMPLTEEEKQTYERAFLDCQELLLNLEMTFTFDIYETLKHYLSCKTPESCHCDCVMQERTLNKERARQGVHLVQLWLKRLSGAIKESISFRRDQLTFIEYHFYTLLCFAVSIVKEVAAEVGVEEWLEYESLRLQRACDLHNAVLIARVLLDRGRIYLDLKRDVEALNDLSTAVACMKIFCETFHRFEEVNALLEPLKVCIDHTKGHTRIKVRALYSDAVRTVRVQMEKLELI